VHFCFEEASPHGLHSILGFFSPTFLSPRRCCPSIRCLPCMLSMAWHHCPRLLGVIQHRLMIYIAFEPAPGSCFKTKHSSQHRQQRYRAGRDSLTLRPSLFRAGAPVRPGSQARLCWLSVTLMMRALRGWRSVPAFSLSHSMAHEGPQRHL
jgi:hypothetical protein